MKRKIIQYICLSCIVSLSYANEPDLLEDFNNNVTLFTKSDLKDLNYMPSLQLATNNKSQMQQEWVENILYNEKLLLQWSNRLSNKYSGHYWVLMTKEDKKPSLVNIAKVRPTTTIQSPNITMEIVIDDKQEKYDLVIKTKIGDLVRIENKKNYNLRSNVVYISSYDVGDKYYWLYSLIVK